MEDIQNYEAVQVLGARAYALIKVVLEVHSDGAIIPTNFTAPKICFVPYKVKHISATNQ